MAEIERGKVEEIDNQQNLGPEKVGACKKYDPTKLEKIIEDKVTSNCSS